MNAASAITLLTPRGRGAVASLRFEGPLEFAAKFFTAANGKPLADQPLNRVVFGHWGEEIPEDIVVCRTAEGVIEIHCHGGDAAAQRIQSDLASAGCLRETWQDMTQRTQGIFLREWTEAVSQATTKRTAGILLAQRELFPQSIQRLKSLLADRNTLLDEIDALLTWGPFGLHLTEPWAVVLGGPPNVGKSSLINALVGYARSIVYDQPGTTRDVVTADTAFDGWPVQLADTAGLRDGTDVLETEGIARAKKRLGSADCQILLLDVSRPITETDRQLRKEFPNAIFVAHKSDLPAHPAAEIPTGAIPVSSITSEGVDQVVQELVKRLILQVPELDQAVPFTTRQINLLEKAKIAATNQDEETLQTAICDLLP